MSDLQTIKNMLLEGENLYTLLEHLDCLNIKYEQGGRLLTAQLPIDFGSDNKRSVQIRINDNIYCNIRSRDFSGDIFNLVSLDRFLLIIPASIKTFLYDFESIEAPFKSIRL